MIAWQLKKDVGEVKLKITDAAPARRSARSPAQVLANSNKAGYAGRVLGPPGAAAAGAGRRAGGAGRRWRGAAAAALRLGQPAAPAGGRGGGGAAAVEPVRRRLRRWRRRGGGGGFGGAGGGNAGPFVLPGTYNVSLVVDGKTVDTKPLKVVGGSRTSALTAIERKKLFDMAMEMHELQRVANEFSGALTPLNAGWARLAKEIASRNDIPADVKAPLTASRRSWPRWCRSSRRRGRRARRRPGSGGGGARTAPLRWSAWPRASRQAKNGLMGGMWPTALTHRRPTTRRRPRPRRRWPKPTRPSRRPRRSAATLAKYKLTLAAPEPVKLPAVDGREQEVARHVREQSTYRQTAAGVRRWPGRVSRSSLFAAPATAGQAAGQPRFAQARGPAADRAALATAKPGRLATQPIDEEYTKKIKEYTTETFFLSPVIDYMPASKTVPTPKAILGDIAGAPGKLPYSKEVHDYMRLLAKSTPRVKVYTIGTTEEGREMIAVAVASEALMAKLDQNKADLAKLADPRTIKMDDAVADEIAKRAAPVYYITGAIHSTEAGAPTALMELAYRLAVDDSPYIRNIREHVITLITPVVEPDGRDRDGGRLRVEEEAPERHAAERGLLGQVRRRTTTTATRWA